jgi:pyruvate/2-oxoglutarate dehydrogenase complex dihydrolipoamide dehydrogenase (E3) component
MTVPERFDAIIIGTGQGGKPLAAALAKAGWKTAIVEREEKIGGTCVVVGCTPTKTMIASARVAYLVNRAAEYGINTGSISVDQNVVRQRKRDIVKMFSGGSKRSIEKLEHNELIMGEASFAGPQEIEVSLNAGGTRRLTSDKIVINVGARPRAPDIPGLDSVPYLNSTTIMELDVVPEHLLVLGGGFIGLEFGQLFRRLGARVTVTDMADRLAKREDPDVSEELVKILREDGIDVSLNSTAKRVAHVNGIIQLTLETADGERTLEGSHLLVSVGRTPNSDSLNLAAAGIEAKSNGLIPVNERLETNVQGVFAIGDVNGGPPFTHISYDDFRILRDNFLDGGTTTTTGRLVPYTVFIDPQLARVGINETEAVAKGLNYQVAKMPMSHVARALEVDETRGFLKAIVDRDTKQILGCTVFGIEGGELMSMLEIAMMGKVSYTVLRDGIFAHPTLAEAFNNLFAKLD